VPCPKDLAYEWQQDTIDDARYTTILSRFADLFREKGGYDVARTEEDPFSEVEFPECVPQSRSGKVTELHLVLPQDLKTQKSLMGHIFTALTFVKEPLCFEVIGTKAEIVVVLACAEVDASQVRQQLVAHEPDCVIDQTEHYLADLWLGEQQTHRVVDFGLEQEAMRPLASAHASYDALTGVMGALSGLGDAECGILQILFQPVRNSWSEALMESVTNYDGSAFFADAAEMVPLAKQKTDSALLACIIRAGASSDDNGRLDEIVRAIGGSLMQLRNPKSNGLFPLNNDHYHDTDHAGDLLARTSHRSGMLLNLEELTTLAHMPDAAIRVAKLKRVATKTKAMPDLTRGHDFALGLNTHGGKENQVTLSLQHRLRHMHLIGASGTGKTTLMLNMIRQDMEQGNGIAVLDPHGDLIDTILKYVPSHRRDDVIVFDPSDEEYPIGFNILDAKTELEKTLLASDLVSVFKRLSTSWGDQMNSVLANGISAMLESDQGGTLPILRRFLVDKNFRTEYLESVKDPENVFYWEKEFPLLSGKPQGPVLTRLDTFLRPKPIRYMVAQKENKIDFADLMQGKKIFLAKLSQGAIGNENSYLLGAFLVTKLNQIAFSRQGVSESQRAPFFLYIDEFHNFITPSMESILSGARKFGLGLILAHQELRQIETRDQDVAASVIANPYTRVCFRLGDNDARKIKNGFSFFQANDLQSLGIGHAIARVEQAQYDFNLLTPKLPETDSNSKQDAEGLVQASKQRYGTPREDVEHLLFDAVGKPRDNSETASKLAIDKPVMPGRGGTKHKMLQQEIKLLGEKAGFRSTIEKSLKDRKGHVDVALERDDLKIAVEISVSTNAEHELQNVIKCLNAGFDHVLAVSEDSAGLKDLEGALTGLTKQQKSKVQCMTSDQVAVFLKKYTARDTSLNGYSVSVEYSDLTDVEQKRKKEKIAALVLSENQES